MLHRFNRWVASWGWWYSASLLCKDACVFKVCWDRACDLECSVVKIIESFRLERTLRINHLPGLPITKPYFKYLWLEPCCQHEWSWHISCIFSIVGSELSQLKTSLTWVREERQSPSPSSRRTYCFLLLTAAYLACSHQLQHGLLFCLVPAVDHTGRPFNLVGWFSPD